MKDSKRVIKALLIFFGIIIGLIALAVLFEKLSRIDGPFGEYMLYRKAKDGNKLWSEDYIERYPNGKYLKKVELAYSQASFIEAKALALDTFYLESNDKCIKLFEFIRRFKNAPEYPEAVKLAENFGYRNYLKLKDWDRIFDYMELFPNSRGTKELTALKDKSIDTAIVRIDSLFLTKALNKGQADLLKAILNGSKNKSSPLTICLKFIPEISIANPIDFKQFSFEGRNIEIKQVQTELQSFPKFSVYHLSNNLSEELFEAFSKFLPGRNFFKFDTLEINGIPVFVIKCKVSNRMEQGKTSMEKPYIGEYFYEKLSTKTITTTKRVSEYSTVQKEWVYKNVTETKTEVDYNGPRSYYHAGYFFYLMFDFKCEISIPGKDEQYRIDFVYKPKVEKVPDSERLNTVYDRNSISAIREFVGKLIPDLEHEKCLKEIENARFSSNDTIKKSTN